MNKKANIYFTLTITMIIWIGGIMLMPYIIDDIDTYRIAMNCASSTISDISKLNCLAVDGLIPYFIWTLSAIALGFIINIK